MAMLWCCAVKIDGAKTLFSQLFSSLTEVSRWTVMREHVCVQLGTSLENCWLGYIRPALRRHYCDYYHWKLQASSPLWTPSWLQTPLDETWSCAVHWGVGPTWVAVRVNYKWCTQNRETVFEHPFLPLRLGCNDIWALVTNSEELKYKMDTVHHRKFRGGQGGRGDGSKLVKQCEREKVATTQPGTVTVLA